MQCFHILVLALFIDLWCFGGSINIALHAQVSPSSGKIVGSVITTQGLKQAFLRRPEVDKVEIFFPFDYSPMFLTKWDLVVIEGWFLSINSFISFCRSLNPQIVVLFIALDPSYPGTSVISKLDVDGYLTNSRRYVDILNEFAPTRYFLLAADPEIMKPLILERKHSSVYVGAGGEMILSKPRLHEMLLDAASTPGFSIFGTNWEQVPKLSSFSHGPLPQNEINLIYSQSHVVLSSTIESQKEWGMINNRVFEALACGSVLISEPFPELEELFGDLIIYWDPLSSRSLSSIIQEITSQNYSQFRTNVRNHILSHHTWHHRVPLILDFFMELFDFQQSNSHYQRLSTSSRSNRRQLAIIVSQTLVDHPDINVLVDRGILPQFAQSYRTKLFSESEWYRAVHYNSSRGILDMDDNHVTSIFCNYHMILAVISPFDSLDLFLHSWSEKAHTLNFLPSGSICPPEEHHSNLGVHQSFLLDQSHPVVGAYLFGIDRQYLPLSATLAPHRFQHYQVLFFRSLQDLSTLESMELGSWEGIRVQEWAGYPSSSKSLMSKDDISSKERRDVWPWISSTSSSAGMASLKWAPLLMSKRVQRLVICHFLQANHCPLQPQNFDLNIEYLFREVVYVLFGGSQSMWLDWLELQWKPRNEDNTPSLIWKMLPSLIFAHPSKVEMLVEWISTVKEVEYCYQLENDITNTIQWILWPMVVRWHAAIDHIPIDMSQAGLKIHFPITPVLQYVESQAISGWRSENLQQAVAIGMLRLEQYLSPLRMSFELSILPSPPSSSSSSSPPAHIEIIRTLESDPVEMLAASMWSCYPDDIPMGIKQYLFLHAKYRGLHVGVNCKMCIEVNLRKESKKVCYFWPYEQIGIQAPTGYGFSWNESEICNPNLDQNCMEVRFVFHPTIVSDVLLQKILRIKLIVRNIDPMEQAYSHQAWRSGIRTCSSMEFLNLEFFK